MILRQRDGEKLSREQWNAHRRSAGRLKLVAAAISRARTRGISIIRQTRWPVLDKYKASCLFRNSIIQLTPVGYSPRPFHHPARTGAFVKSGSIMIQRGFIGGREHKRSGAVTNTIRPIFSFGSPSERIVYPWP